MVLAAISSVVFGFLTPPLAVADTPPAPGPATTRAAVTVTPAEGTELNWSPRAVVLAFPAPGPGPEVEVTLQDDEGYRYPPAVPSEITGSELRYFTPQLPDGTYTVSWSGPFAGSSVFSVRINGSSAALNPSVATPGTTDPAAELATGDPATDPRGLSPWLVLIVTLSIAVLLALLARRHRRLALVATALLIATASAAVWVGRTTSPTDARARCLGLEGEPRLECLTAVVLAAYDATGEIRAATEELHAVEQDPRFRSAYGESVCHSVAHMAARVVVAREGSISRVTADADLLCASGFLHGALEGGAPLLSTELFSEEVLGVCGSGTDNGALECAHGIGHAAALRFNSRIFEAADLCLALANEPQVTQCLLGVSMLSGNWVGNMAARDATPAAFTPPGVLVGQIGEPCLDPRFIAVPDRFRACLEGIFFYMKSGAEIVERLPAPWDSVDTIAAWCVDVVRDHAALEAACFASLGAASALRLEVAPAELPGVCSRAPGEAGLQSCVDSLVTQVRNNQDAAPPRAVFDEICANVPASVAGRCQAISDMLLAR